MTKLFIPVELANALEKLQIAGQPWGYICEGVLNHCGEDAFTQAMEGVAIATIQHHEDTLSADANLSAALMAGHATSALLFIEEIAEQLHPNSPFDQDKHILNLASQFFSHAIYMLLAERLDERADAAKFGPENDNTDNPATRH